MIGCVGSEEGSSCARASPVALHGVLSLLGGNTFEWHLRTERGPADLEGVRAGLPVVPDTPARMWGEVALGSALLACGAALRRTTTPALQASER